MALLAALATLGAMVAPYIPGITIVTAPTIPLWGPFAAVAGIMATFTGGLGLWINGKIERQAAVEKKELGEFRKNVFVGVFFIFMVVALTATIAIIRMRRKAKQPEERNRGFLQVFRQRIPFLRR